MASVRYFPISAQLSTSCANPTLARYSLGVPALGRDPGTGVPGCQGAWSVVTLPRLWEAGARRAGGCLNALLRCLSHPRLTSPAGSVPREGNRSEHRETRGTAVAGGGVAAPL